MHSRQLPAANYVKEYINQQRGSSARNETYLFVKNDSVLDFRRTLNIVLIILGSLSFQENTILKVVREKSTTMPCATSHRVFLSRTFLLSLSLKQGCPLQHFAASRKLFKSAERKRLFISH